MSACAECLRASLLRAEITSVMESSGAGAVAARRALEADPDEMLFTLESRGGAEPAFDELLAALSSECRVWTVCRHDPEFPAGLTGFAREADIPHVIYGVGEKRHFDELREPGGIAIVGARRATAYGREVAYSLAQGAAGLGLTVISGMALGIDGAAHRGSLQGGGPTIAVLAGGPNVAYPRSHRLLHQQLLERGCAISENPPGVQARRWAFVARNRIIAAMSRIVVFAEGSAESGARHTVEFATQLDIPVGAVPGPITSPLSAGPNGLLGAEGVITVRGIDDISQHLQLDRLVFSSGFTDDPGSLAERVLGLVAAGERTPQALAAAIEGCDPREISRALGELELKGRVKRAAGGEYERLL
ncbi:MAG: DNA-protecting protein DprA [Solirubrobacterales bacterium]